MARDIIKPIIDKVNGHVDANQELIEIWQADNKRDWSVYSREKGSVWWSESYGGH